MWVSSQARAIWEPRLQAASRAWQSLERASVYAGVRQTALQAAAPDELPALMAEAAERSASVLTLAKQASGGSYSASAKPAAAGERFNYRVAITYDPREFMAAWRAQDDEAIGIFLGFPGCCLDFFARTWGAGLVDTTAEMGAGATLECNILGRWLGIRWSPHLPCSFACEATQAFGRRFRAIAEDIRVLNAFTLAELLDEILQWPWEWSALHGIAEIKCPVLKISTRTNVYAEKRVVRWTGDGRYPAEGARGLHFPYRTNVAQTTRSMASRVRAIEATAGSISPLVFVQQSKGRSLREAPSTEAPAARSTAQSTGAPDVPEHPADQVPLPHITSMDPREWTDNGFSSREAMNAAHDMVIASLPHSYDGRMRVLDLGCGNGLLLKKIADRGASDVLGVESDPARAARAVAPVRVGQIRDLASLVTEQFDVALISARRFREMTLEELDAFNAWAQTHLAARLIYSYDTPMYARVEWLRPTTPSPDFS